MTAESKSLRQRQYNSSLARYRTEPLLIGILAVLFLLFGNTSPVFFQLEALMKFPRQASIYGIITIRMALVIISSGIDIPVGFVTGFSGVIVAMTMVNSVPIPITILLAVVSGALVGLFNGILVYDANVPSFIVTLDSLTIVRDPILSIAGAKTISNLPEVLTNFVADSLLGIPYLFLLRAAFVCIGLFIVKKTISGRNMCAYGSNKEAARLNDIHVRPMVYGVYIFCSSVCGITEILPAPRLDNGVPNAGAGYELDTIMAVVVGRASLDGGEGSVIGAVLGVMIVATLRQGGTPLGINSFIMEIIIDSPIAIAAALDKVRKKRN